MGLRWTWMAPVSPPPAEPPRVTVLWPLVDDRPRLLQPVPQGRPLLADDGLADSLAPGGRLFSLLDAVDKPTRGVESELRRSLCLAVDPSLLETVRAMTQDYLVRTPDGRTVAGEGVEAARRWLDRLRALAVGQCVFALPYADADLVALSRAGATDLQRIAAGGAGLVQAVLAPAQALPGVVWPIEAAIDQRTVSDLASDSPTTILVDETRLRRAAGGGGGPFALGSPAERETGRGSRIMPVDALVSTSLSGRQPEATTPASVQNGLATLVFRVALQDTPDRSVVVAPPRRWTAPAGELTVFLDTLAALFDQDLTNPLPLAGALNAPLDGTVDGLDYTAEDAGSEVSGPVMSAVTQANAVQRDLLGAMQTDATTQVQPQSLIDPLQYGLLRATSGAWRGTADGSTRAVTDVQAALTAIRGQVTVVRPAVPYTLASADSELPVQITNGLPVAIRVHISVRDSAGLRPSAIPQQDIPAHSGITRSIPAEVIRSGRFTVDIGLTTPSGSTSLGEPSRFELSSTSYGTITLAITGTAAAALVLLFGRRIYRRIRKPRASALEQGSGQG